MINMRQQYLKCTFLQTVIVSIICSILIAAIRWHKGVVNIITHFGESYSGGMDEIIMLEGYYHVSLYHHGERLPAYSVTV